MIVNAAVSNIRDARLLRTAFADSERGGTPRTRKIRRVSGEEQVVAIVAPEAAEANQQ